MTFLTRQAFAKQFGKAPDELDMHVIYDVSHNIAKVSRDSLLACVEGVSFSTYLSPFRLCNDFLSYAVLSIVRWSSTWWRAR